jgi:hypothetical protein
MIQAKIDSAEFEIWNEIGTSGQRTGSSAETRVTYWLKRSHAALTEMDLSCTTTTDSENQSGI